MQISIWKIYCKTYTQINESVPRSVTKYNYSRLKENGHWYNQVIKKIKYCFVKSKITNNFLKFAVHFDTIAHWALCVFSTVPRVTSPDLTTLAHLSSVWARGVYILGPSRKSFDEQHNTTHIVAYVDHHNDDEIKPSPYFSTKLDKDAGILIEILWNRKLF